MTTLKPTVDQQTLVEHAQAAYARRAEARRRLRHTNTDIRALLTGYAQQHPDLRRIPIRSALNDLPGLGPTRTTALLNTTHIDGTKPLARLTTKEGNALADLLDP